MKRKKTSILCTVLMLALTTSMIPTQATTASTKEEIVYVTLLPDGTPQDHIITNILQGSNQLDYGNYEWVTAKNNDTNLTYLNQSISITSSKNEQVYEGKLETLQLPWTFEIQYLLDGSPMDASELAGMSGELQLILDVKENPLALPTFFESHALQITIALDRQQTQNLDAPKATIATVGNQKQILYTILPGNSLSTSITMQVEDFRMDAIQFTGIEMQLDVPIDEQALYSELKPVQDGATALYEGSLSLEQALLYAVTTGNTQFVEAFKQMRHTLSLFEQGTEALTIGSEAFVDGSLQSAEGAKKIEVGLQIYQQAVVEFHQIYEQMDSHAQDLSSGSTQIQMTLSQLDSSLSRLDVAFSDVSQLVNGTYQLMKLMESLTTGLKEWHSSLGYGTFQTMLFDYGLDIDVILAANKEWLQTLQPHEQELIIANITILETLNPYFTSLQEHTTPLLIGLQEANNVSQQLYTSITSLEGAINTMAYEFTQLTHAISVLNEAYTGFHDSLTTYSQSMSELIQAQAPLQVALENLLEGSRLLSLGNQELYLQSQTLHQGSLELQSGSVQLSYGVSSLESGFLTYLDGLTQIYFGSQDLVAGSALFNAESQAFQQRIGTQLDQLFSGLSKKQATTASFTDERNTNVSSVQFVMQTQKIEPNTVTEAPDKIETTLSFWQKLLQRIGF